MYARVKRGIDNIQPELLALTGFDDRSGVVHTGVDAGYVGVLEAIRIAGQVSRLIAVVGDVDTEIAIRQRLRGTGAGKQTNGRNKKQYGFFSQQLPTTINNFIFVLIFGCKDTTF